MSVVDLEQKTLAKIKNLNTFNQVEALQTFLSVRPLGSRNKDIIKQDLECLQAILMKFTEKDFESLLANFKEEEVELVIDYLHRFMQFVGES